MRIRIPIFTVSTIAFCLFCNSVNAQWSADPTVNNAITAATSTQMYPKITRDGFGGAVITWEDGRNGNSDIYAQRIDAGGTIHTGWTSGGVAISTQAGEQIRPQLVSDGSGGAIITWPGGGIGNYNICAQRIDADGTIHTGWAANGVPLSTATIVQQAPQIVSDGSGGAIITWENWGTYPAVDIYAQRIDADGTIHSGWATNGVAICAAAGEQTVPQITSDGSGGAIITWMDLRGGTYYDVYAQRIDANGSIHSGWAANGVAICTAANDQRFPQLISDGSSGAIITWSDNRSGTNYDIYAQRINATGDTLWAANGVSICKAANDQRFPQLISDGGSGAIITWEDIRDGSSYDIYAQKINSSGVGQWGANGTPICVDANFQDVAQITSDGSGGAIITWEDYRNTNYDVYAQRINSSGTILWTTDGVAVFIHTAHNADKPYPQLVSDGSGGAIIAWMEIYNVATSYDIYASRIGSNGVLPVELTSFSASSRQNAVELQWSTATEVNNEGFEIERRQIGNSNFEIRNWSKIGFVSGSGTASSPHEYSFTDRNLIAGRYAYRISQVDRNGSSKYLSEAEVEVGTAPKEFTLSDNYPNPFNPSTTIEFSVPEDGRAVLKIVDMIGRDVATLFEGEVKSGSYQRVVFDASKLASGIYFSRLEFGGKQQLKKMILMK